MQLCRAEISARIQWLQMCNRVRLQRVPAGGRRAIRRSRCYGGGKSDQEEIEKLLQHEIPFQGRLRRCEEKVRLSGGVIAP